MRCDPAKPAAIESTGAPLAPTATLSNHTENSPSNWSLIGRLMKLAWRHRAGCIVVFAQQSALTMLALLQLGLTGLGIDFIRSVVSPSSGAAHWPLGWQPPQNWPPLAVVGLVSATIIGVALLHGSLRFWGAITMSNLVQQIVIRLRTDVYNKLQRLS